MLGQSCRSSKPRKDEASSEKLCFRMSSDRRTGMYTRNGSIGGGLADIWVLSFFVRLFDVAVQPNDDVCKPERAQLFLTARNVRTINCPNPYLIITVSIRTSRYAKFFASSRPFIPAAVRSVHGRLLRQRQW